MKRSNWTKDELILVMNLYTKIRYGQFHNKNPEVIHLANLIGKTPGAVAYKLVHLSSQDPYHKNRGVRGLANPGRNAVSVYAEFMENWDEMLLKSEVLLAKIQNKSIEELLLKEDEIKEIEIDRLTYKQGIDVRRYIKIRVNQALFRRIVVSNYSNSCAVCGLDVENLLVASHIIRWSENETHRLNPENGMCLCNIHDKAFELGFIGITQNYKISISGELFSMSEKNTFYSLFQRHDNRLINLPDKFYPSLTFLKQHFDSTFRK